MPMPPSPSPNPSAPQGQPPVGSSPATGPVPNKGQEAAGMAKLGLAIRLLESIVPQLGAGTEAGRDVLKALTSLSKHLPPGAVSPGVEKTSLMNMMQSQRQQQPQIAAMRAAMAGGQSPGGQSPGGQPGGEPPTPPAQAA